jgi:hypothetical protein
MIYENLKTGEIDIDPKFPPGLPQPDLSTEFKEKLEKPQKRIKRLERKAFLEGSLVAIRASNTTGARQAYSNATGNDQVRSGSLAFGDGWKSAYEHVEKHICDELTLIVAELEGTVVP